MVGQTVGKYQVVARLGRGGMGTVYKATDQTLGRDVAIKSLNPDLCEADTLQRFRAEAQTLARLNHPNIATLYELAEHQGELLMVMEFVSGDTFDKVSEKSGPLPVGRAAQLCAQVLDALTYAHRAGVIHRDLKPANLMLTDSGLAKVMDFGIARVSGTEHLTVDGFMMGTPAYMAPEQVLGGDIDGRTDLYAMGVVFYRLLTGTLPFKADSGIVMVQKQLHDMPTPVRQVRPDLPEGCERLLTRALAKAPADRFQSAEEFRSALTALAAVDGPAGLTGAMPATPNIAADPAFETTLPPTPTPAIGSPATAALAALQPTPLTPARRLPVAAFAVAAVVLAGVPAAVLLARHPKAVLAPPPQPVAAVTQAAALPAPAAPAAETPVPSSLPLAETVAPAKPTPVVPSAKTLPPVTFTRAKLLVMTDGKSSDRDVTVRLGQDGLQVLDAGETIQTASYHDVVGLFESHSREPRWAKADGTVVAVAKAGGRFSFLKGTPQWLTVKTKTGFIPLRLQDADLLAATAALETRTGAKLVHTR